MTSPEMSKTGSAVLKGKTGKQVLMGVDRGENEKGAGREGGVVGGGWRGGPIRERLPLFGHHVTALGTNEKKQEVKNEFF